LHSLYTLIPLNSNPTFIQIRNAQAGNADLSANLVPAKRPITAFVTIE
jgi:hypothetical protein